VTPHTKSQVVGESVFGIAGGLLAMILESSFIFLFTLYLNTQGSSRLGSNFLGGGNKLKSSYS
jgi:hypothetical protein